MSEFLLNLIAEMTKIFLKYYFVEDIVDFSKATTGKGLKKDLSGGAIQVSLLKRLVQAMEDPVESFVHNKKTYTKDPEFATREFNVYTSGEKVYMLHSPTNVGDVISFKDIVADIALALNIKTKRVTEVVKLQIKAEEKYLKMGKSDITTVGYSLGSFVAEEGVRKGSKSREVFIISRPISILNLHFVLPKNVFSIKSKLDPVGILGVIKDFVTGNRSSQDILATEGAQVLKFWKEHLAPLVLERLENRGIEEIGIPEIEEVENPVGSGKKERKEKWSRRRIADLKAEVKELRRVKKQSTKKYPIVGKNKEELIKMVIELRAL